LNLFQEWWGGNKRMVERVNLSMTYLVYYMNFCKCYNVALLRTIIKMEKKIKENWVR
jgi:hypothetical protein